MAEPIKKEQNLNYQKKLDHILEEVLCHDTKPSLLLHSCCGPCSSYCLSYLYQYFDITVFYYNPNIDPKEEYDHRLSVQRALIDRLNADLDAKICFLEGEYDHNDFLIASQGLELEPEGGKRCSKCFSLRLNKTCQKAAELGFDYFGTTLTVSPHKNALVINEIGMETAKTIENASVFWLPSDFKKKNGYQISIQLSRKYDLYRQDYCGCEFARK